MDEKGFAQRLKSLVDEYTDGNFSRFARLVGISIPTFQKYLAGDSYPSMKNLIKICAFAQVSADWLIYGHGLRNKTLLLELSRLPDPLLEHIAASIGRNPKRPNGQDIPVIRRGLDKNSGRGLVWWEEVLSAMHDECEFVMMVEGDEMEPLLAQGDLVGIGPIAIQPREIDGKWIATKDGHAVRFFHARFHNDQFIFFPHNLTKHTPITVSFDEARRRIIGRVLWFWRRIHMPPIE